MSSKRYTEEFKVEAVRQVTDRGHSVAEVADRLGVSIHSLYTWRRSSTVGPGPSGQRRRTRRTSCAGSSRSFAGSRRSATF